MNDAYQSDDFLTDIDDVKAARKRSSREPTRFRDYQYLDAVYQTYVRIRSEKVKTLAVTVIREDLNIKVNRDAHLIRAIIDATCKADFKVEELVDQGIEVCMETAESLAGPGKVLSA